MTTLKPHYKHIEPYSNKSGIDNSSLDQTIYQQQASNNERDCGTCTRPSNNKYFDCPPRMSDGRLFTNYRSRCDINYVTSREPGSTMDSYAYRQHLLANGENIMKSMRECATNNAKCGPCVEPFQVGTMLPEQQIDVCDEKTCYRKNVEIVPPEGGLGLGRWFGSFSDAAPVLTNTPYERAEEIYGNDNISNKTTKSKKTNKNAISKPKSNCCETPDDTLNYFPPLELQNISASINRVSSPYGGVPLSGGDPSVARRPTSIFDTL
jgi:hypothetical protein